MQRKLDKLQKQYKEHFKDVDLKEGLNPVGKKEEQSERDI